MLSVAALKGCASTAWPMRCIAAGIAGMPAATCCSTGRLSKRPDQAVERAEEEVTVMKTGFQKTSRTVKQLTGPSFREYQNTSSDALGPTRSGERVRHGQRLRAPMISTPSRRTSMKKLISILALLFAAGTAFAQAGTAVKEGAKATAETAKQG